MFYLGFFLLALVFNTNFAKIFVDLQSNENTLTQFENYVKKFNKKYLNNTEYTSRFKIFAKNIQTIQENNLKSKNIIMRYNQFTDLTLDEFTSQFNSFNKIRHFDCDLYATDNLAAGNSIDWRTSNYVSSIKDQGNCNAGWAFASSGAVESASAIAYNVSVNELSTEQVIECTYGFEYNCYQCDGGDISGSFKHIRKTGLCALSTYPYSSSNGSVSYCKGCLPISFLTNCFNVKKNNETLLKQAVFQRPVASYLDVSTEIFQHYSGGIIGQFDCGTEPNHGILIIGYGEENSGQKYWLVKNSWGISWGIDGYVKIARTESTSSIGACGIAKNPSFPIIKIK